MREDLDVKARRYLSDGRMRIHRADSESVLARVDGDSGTYRLVWDRSGILCLCPARERCSHIEALRLVSDGPTRKELAAMNYEPETLDTSVSEPDEEVGPEPAELATLDPETDPVLLPLDSAEISFQTLQSISATEFVPTSLRGRPMAMLAAVLTGRELGLKPMESLTHIVLVDGRPSLSAQLVNRLIREAGHTIEVIESNNTICTLRGTRQPSGETQELSFSIDDATRAGLTSRSAWKNYPTDMLWARTLSRLHKRLFPDVGHGAPGQGEGNQHL